ncbi:MAG: hypothetical protein ACKPKO_60980, partial [Candidatus Fonsibacter sp.]
TYTKTEVDGLVSPMSDKTYVDSNQLTTYTQTEVDTGLGLKANQSSTHTNTFVCTALGLKANQSTTYTKTEVYTALALKGQSISHIHKDRGLYITS